MISHLRPPLGLQEMDISPQMQEYNKAAARAAQKVGKGHLGRAAHALASNSALANCGDEAVIAKLRALHPALPPNSTTPAYPIINLHNHSKIVLDPTDVSFRQLIA